jgi:hypothetical protein
MGTASKTKGWDYGERHRNWRSCPRVIRYTAWTGLGKRCYLLLFELNIKAPLFCSGLRIMLLIEGREDLQAKSSPEWNLRAHGRGQ